MSKATLGGIQTVVGAIGLAVVYSLRPPAGFGEALTMLGQGRHQYIREPLYEILLASFALTSIFGLIRVIAGQKEQK